MQHSLLVPSVVFLFVSAFITGCAASKEYTSKIFPTQAMTKDSTAVVLRFLELEGLSGDESNWVSTDIINGRDTVSQTLALDNFSKRYPASQDSVKTIPDKLNKVTPVPEVAKRKNMGEVRQKRSRE